jgi:putative membrane protein
VKIDLWVFVKGALMGAADIVPGVSGGTIAFITGIYERLLSALNSILPALFQLVKTRSPKGFWLAIDGAFLLTLFVGIITSAVSLAKVITFLLVAYPVPLWASFFGLIAASVYVVGRDIQVWNVRIVLLMLAGALAAWGLTSMSPASVEHTAWAAFASGLLAICAMVLPGISGSFILVILGTYSFILSAVKGFELLVLGLFMLGCLLGILSIARVLVWAFARYKDATLAILTGFMIGALNKVWPWKEVLSYRENRHGESVPLMESNVLPETYAQIMQEPSYAGLALACALGSAILVSALAHFGAANESNDTKGV